MPAQDDDFVVRIPRDMLRGRPDPSTYLKPDDGRRDQESYDRRLRERLLGEAPKLAADTHHRGGPGREEVRLMRDADAEDAAPFKEQAPTAPSTPRIGMPDPGQSIYEGWRQSSVGNQDESWKSAEEMSIAGERINPRQFGGVRQEQNMVEGDEHEHHPLTMAKRVGLGVLAGVAFSSAFIPDGSRPRVTPINRVM